MPFPGRSTIFDCTKIFRDFYLLCYSNYRYTYGKNIIPEKSYAEHTWIHQYWTEVPHHIAASGPRSTHVFVTSLSTVKDDAWQAYQMALGMTADELIATHSEVNFLILTA